jgi:hypothetical protein
MREEQELQLTLTAGSRPIRRLRPTNRMLGDARAEP